MRGKCGGEDGELLHTKNRRCSVSTYQNGSPDTKVKHTHNSLTAMYNLLAELDLGLGQVALHHILCTCAKCIKQRNKKPWALNVGPNPQPLYASNTECDMRPIFHGLNDWGIVELKPTSNGEHKEDLQVAQNIVLESLEKLSWVKCRRAMLQPSPLKIQKVMGTTMLLDSEVTHTHLSSKHHLLNLIHLLLLMNELLLWMHNISIW
jgi:hypothetical protein